MCSRAGYLTNILYRQTKKDSLSESLGPIKQRRVRGVPTPAYTFTILGSPLRIPLASSPISAEFFFLILDDFGLEPSVVETLLLCGFPFPGL